MKNVLIILGIMVFIIGFIFLCIWLGQEIANFRFENWKQYMDYMKKVRI